MTLFEAAKSVDSLGFATLHLNIEFNRHAKAKSPFRSDEKTPSFSFKDGLFSDFGGDFKGTLIDLIMALKNLSNGDAAKYICDAARIAYDEGKKPSTPKAAFDMQSFFKECHNRLVLNFRDYLPHLEKIFVNVQKIVHDDMLFRTLGWDNYNNTLVIGVFDGERVINIKWREKKGFPGKWISAAAKDGATTGVFPNIANFKEYAVVVEGEKDALNLAALGINAITIGGVGSSWEKFANALVGINTVYIWFDYDRAGFEAVLPRSKEFYKMGVKIVYYMDLERLCHKKQLFEKFDVSDYLVLYPLENEAEFLALSQKSFLVPKKTASTSSMARTVLIESLRVTETMEDLSSISKFEYSLLSKIERFKGSLFSWADKKNFDIQKLKNATSKTFDAIMKDGNVDNAKELSRVLASVSNLEKEINYFSVEKRIVAAEYLMSECQRLGFELRSDGMNVYYYNGRYFTKWSINDFHRFYLLKLSKVIVQVQDVAATESIYLNLVEIVPRLHEEDVDRNIIINTLNCVVDMTRGKTLKHNVGFNFDYILPFEYDKDAKCPLFDEFLDSSLPNKALQNVALEFIAYSIMSGSELQKFLLLTGSGANGKSVFMNVFKAFLNPSSIGRVMHFEGFAMEGLVGKKVNFAEDRTLTGVKRDELDYIKMMSDGTPFEIRAIYRGSVLIERPPKLVISTNNMPRITDPSFVRRLVLLPFEQTFTYDNPNSRYRRIDGLDKMIIRNELSGVFNRVLEAMRRLMQNGRFSAADEVKNIINEFELDANNVYRFASEFVKLNSEVDFITVQSVYDRYRVFCESEGVQAKNKNNFGKDIKEFMKLDSRVMNVNGISTRVYSGVELK